MSGWIAHDGGECPVPPETLVRVRFYGVPRADAERLSPFVAGHIRWKHNGSGGDIFDYQIAEAPAAEAAATGAPTAPAPKDEGPAFPVSDIGTHGHYGMSLRDWFAGQALISMGLWTPRDRPMDVDARAEWSYRQAAALMAVRAATPDGRHE